MHSIPKSLQTLWLIFHTTDLHGDICAAMMGHLIVDRSAGVGRSPAPLRHSILSRFSASALLLCLLVSLLPTAIADDDWSTANVLTDGSSSSDAVDDEGDSIIGYMSLVYYLDDLKIGESLIGETPKDKSYHPCPPLSDPSDCHPKRLGEFDC